MIYFTTDNVFGTAKIKKTARTDLGISALLFYRRIFIIGMSAQHYAT
jgi:hypothetical protein